MNSSGAFIFHFKTALLLVLERGGATSMGGAGPAVGKGRRAPCVCLSPLFASSQCPLCQNGRLCPLIVNTNVSEM